MNKGQMAAYITAKVGQTDDQSVSACLGFLEARHKMIWDTAIWAGAQALVTVSSVSTGDFSIVEFPDNVDRVLHMRNTDGSYGSMLGTSLGTIFDYNADLFNATGTWARYVHLRRAPHAVGLNLGTVTLDGTFTIGPDTGKYELHGADASGRPIQETLTVACSNYEGATFDFGTNTGADMINGGVGRGFAMSFTPSVRLGIWFNVDSVLGQPNMAGLGVSDYLPVNVLSGDNSNQLANAVQAQLSLLGYDSSVTGGALTMQAQAFGPLQAAADFDIGAAVTITQGSIGTEATTSQSFSELYYILTDSVGVQVFRQNGAEVLGDWGQSQTVFNGVFGTIFPSTATIPGILLERVKVFSTPTTAQTYLAHVKLKPSPFDSEEDELLLSGEENALLALAQSDMLERQRQYAKAAAKAQEGNALIQAMLDLEKNQQSYDARIIPVLTGAPDWRGGDGFYEGSYFEKVNAP